MKKLVALMMAMMMLLSCTAGWASEEEAAPFAAAYMPALYETAADVVADMTFAAAVAIFECSVELFEDFDASSVTTNCFVGFNNDDEVVSFVFSLNDAASALVVVYDAAAKAYTASVIPESFPTVAGIWANAFTELYNVTAENIYEAFTDLLEIILGE